MVATKLENEWVQGDLETQASSYAIAQLVPTHFNEVKDRKEELVAKTIAAVKRGHQ